MSTAVDVNLSLQDVVTKMLDTGRNPESHLLDYLWIYRCMQQDSIADKREEHNYPKSTSGDHLDLKLAAGMGTKVADWSNA